MNNSWNGKKKQFNIKGNRVRSIDGWIIEYDNRSMDESCRCLSICVTFQVPIDSIQFDWISSWCIINIIIVVIIIIKRLGNFYDWQFTTLEHSIENIYIYNSFECQNVKVLQIQWLSRVSFGIQNCNEMQCDEPLMNLFQMFQAVQNLHLNYGFVCWYKGHSHSNQTWK